MEFQGGAANDRFVSHVAGISVTARGFAGNDYLQGSSGVDRLYGDAGNDSLHGFDGLDQLFGGDGNDVLVGGAGDDLFYGGNGNDFLYGGSGSDQLSGNAGDDRIWGDTGNDNLWGGEGKDTLLGGWGDDNLFGGLGEDHLNGQAGADLLWGQDGNDTLVAIDGSSSDKINGGAGSDVCWQDLAGGKYDRNDGLTLDDRFHAVTGFENGADLTLDGDRLADPALRSGLVYKNFSGPLFASSGPRVTDPVQGDLGDCYLIAGLSAMAYDTPATIKGNLVDFNDGTYGVFLGFEYYRVDGDLPVFSATSTSPAFAQLGPQGSLWVSIAEKAYAFYRSPNRSYAAIEGGWQHEVFAAFGAFDWGHTQFTHYTSAASLVSRIYMDWVTLRSSCVAFVGTAAYTYGIVMNHAYTVYSFQRDSSGSITGITLRNPWGVDGSNRDSNPNDGLVTLTTNELFALRNTGWIEFGRFL